MLTLTLPAFATTLIRELNKRIDVDLDNRPKTDC